MMKTTMEMIMTAAMITMITTAAIMDDNNNGSNKELYLDENESEDKCKDKEKEKDKLMLDDTPPKAPVSHYFLILALLSDLCKHFVHAYRERYMGPLGATSCQGHCCISNFHREEAQALVGDSP